jgi:hypothetical protein
VSIRRYCDACGVELDLSASTTANRIDGRATIGECVIGVNVIVGVGSKNGDTVTMNSGDVCGSCTIKAISAVGVETGRIPWPTSSSTIDEAAGMLAPIVPVDCSEMRGVLAAMVDGMDRGDSVVVLVGDALKLKLSPGAEDDDDPADFGGTTVDGTQTFDMTVDVFDVYHVGPFVPGRAYDSPDVIEAAGYHAVEIATSPHVSERCWVASVERLPQTNAAPMSMAERAARARASTKGGQR